MGKMGKSFQNFMCKKDFHPRASWNLKKVWEAREIESQKKKREEELRVQYEKEQEVLNNKALLGDEKAKLGLSFLYDAPAGMSKKEETKEEPKFEWQRKYQAPREEWAKDNKLIQDQPFGIEVRNVRCSKCHQWGHVNTDSLCPLYQMSGNHQDAGYRNNPSALFKEYHKKKTENGPSVTTDRSDDQWVDNEKLHEEMSKEHGFALKNSLMRSISIDQKLKGRKAHKTEKIGEAGQMKDFLSNMDEKEKRKLMKKLMKSEKRGKKVKKSRKRRT